jgi:amphi-Trp domain-containing protein
MTSKPQSERIFEHESLQDRESILAYLRALTEGFENGVLTLSDNTGEIILEPNGLVNFLVKASKKRSRVNLNLKISWNSVGDGAGDEPDPKLRISAENGDGN